MAKSPMSSIIYEQRNVLNTLKKDTSIIILPADNGRENVVLNMERFHHRMTKVITPATDVPFQRTILTVYELKITYVLCDLSKEMCMNEHNLHKLRPSQKQPHRNYGLSKIYKPNTLLRPIVSCLRSFAYNLSIYLVDIVQPQAELCDHTVKNSTSFDECLRYQSIPDNEIMVSFDTESMCINVSVDATYSIDQQCTQTDKDFTYLTILSHSQLT